jgi:hypothetical protein
MAEWVSIPDGFIAADVVRFKETAYHARKTRRGRAVRLGERLLTAEVLQGPDSKGWVRLLVRKCETLVEFTTRRLPVYLNGAEIKRARKTIMRGNPERLLWSDESARAVVASESPVKPIPPSGADDGAHSGTRTRSRWRKPPVTRPSRKPPVPDR